MQERATAAIYGPRVIGGERHDVTRHARWVVEIDVGQTFPAAADADNLAFVFSAAIHHTLYDHVQTRDVATAGENSDAFVRHDRVPRVKRSLYSRAVGYNYEATKIFMPANREKPVIVPYIEHTPPDVTAGTRVLACLLACHASKIQQQFTH